MTDILLQLKNLVENTFQYSLVEFAAAIFIFEHLGQLVLYVLKKIRNGGKK